VNKASVSGRLTLLISGGLGANTSDSESVYAGGVKANVLFFDKRPAGDKPWTTNLWVYDLRTNQHFTQKTNPLQRHHLDEFVEGYKAGRPRSERVESERWKVYSYDELMERDKANLGAKAELGLVALSASIASLKA
jgi:type I restriction-modification system DNA methylase subunit